MSKSSKKLILIDGNAIIHRAYHALPPLMTKEGELVNAVYGFASTTLSVISKFQPDYILATFDLAGPTFRHKEYKEYKAMRVKPDQELYDQIPKVKEVVRAMGIPILEQEGYEADDVIGTLVTQSEELKNPPTDELENIIVTGDLDTLQLVTDKTKVYTMRRGLTDSVMYDAQKIMERYGIEPFQVVDFKGLSGDPSDNIPGVKGIGEKTATKLLKKYKTIEGVYAHIGEIKGTVREKLERDKMQAIQSKHLATIVKNVPIKLNLEKAETNNFNREELVKLFQELNFYSLIKRLPDNNSNLQTDSSSILPLKRGEGKEGVKDFKYKIVKDIELNEFIKELKKQKEVALAIERTPSLTLPLKEEERIVKGIAFSWKTGRAGYVKFNEENQLLIKNILENKNIEKIGYDLKRSLEALNKYEINFSGKLYDVMIAAYVLNPGPKIEFSRLVLSELGEEIGQIGKKGQLDLEMESPEKLAQKICKRADYVFKLKAIYKSKIEKISQEQKSEHNLEKIFKNLDMPLVRILASMEIYGVRLNTIIFKGISKKIGIRIKKLEENIYKLAGTKFNINSPKQLAEILFEKLKLPTDDIKKGKTDYSTASAELQKLKGKNKIIEKIEEYREIFKLKTTYLDTLPLLVDKNSRIHSTFNQTVTATGRLSSSDPNLQNIPTRTDLGQLLRVAFEASKGWRLISVDYSQIDLRVVAHESNDKKMIDLFWQGKDIHRATAAEINKVAVSKVTGKMRNAAKALNFGVIYGMSVFGFSQSAGVSHDEARKFIDTYFKKFPGVAEYLKKTKQQAKLNGWVETEMGRRRYVPEINSSNFRIQNSGERMAVNMPIQGMSADIVKLAMIKIYEEFKNNVKVRMILQIHDEIILEVREDLAEEVSGKVKEIMENAYKLKVPLIVDVKVGDNWGEL